MFDGFFLFSIENDQNRLKFTNFKNRLKFSIAIEFFQSRMLWVWKIYGLGYAYHMNVGKFINFFRPRCRDSLYQKQIAVVITVFFQHGLLLVIFFHWIFLSRLVIAGYLLVTFFHWLCYFNIGYCWSFSFNMICRKETTQHIHTQRPSARKRAGVP